MGGDGVTGAAGGQGSGNSTVPAGMPAAAGEGGFPFRAVVLTAIAGTTCVSAHYASSIVAFFAKWITRIAILWLGSKVFQLVWRMDKESLSKECHYYFREITHFKLKESTMRFVTFVQNYFFSPGQPGPGPNGGDDESKR